MPALMAARAARAVTATSSTPCFDRAPTESDLILAHRASALTAWCEEREAAMSRGEPIDMPAFVTSANSLRRLLSDLRRRGRAA